MPASRCVVATVAYLVLHAVGWVRLPGTAPLPEATVTAAKQSPFEGIFNQGTGETNAIATRFHGTGVWARDVEADLTRRLSASGILDCSDGRPKVVNDGHALKSIPLPELPPLATAGIDRQIATDIAAVLGRQDEHSDAKEPPDGSIAGLPDADKPLSVMIGIEPGAELWIYPNGCHDKSGAWLVSLNVGEVLVWKGDLVHAGKGYGVEHYRIHAYVDPPADIYDRPKGETQHCGLARVLFDSSSTERPPGESANVEGGFAERVARVRERKAAEAAAKKAAHRELIAGAVERAVANANRAATAAAAAAAAHLQRQQKRATPQSPSLSGGGQSE